MSLGLKLLASLVKTGDLHQFLQLGMSEDHFLPSEKDTYVAMVSHIKKFGVIPHAETVAEYVPDIPLPEHTPEPPEFYFEQVKERYVTNALRNSMLKSKDLLMAGNVKDAVGTMIESATSLTVQSNEKKIIDFRMAQKIICDEYIKQVKGENNGIPFGWKYLDDMSAGLQPGDFVSIIGRPQQGKTQALLRVGHNAWKLLERSVLLISMEMKPIPMMQRLVNMDMGINLGHLKKGELTSKKFTEMKKGLLSLQNNKSPFWIVDGNLTSSVDDVWALCQQFKPGLVLVDGAYLMQTDNPRDSRWEKMAKSAEGLKSLIASTMDIPVVATYQFSKDSAKKKKKGTKLGLEDIYGSDTIAQISSVALGILQEESAETINTKTITVLKGRNGEAGEFKINFNHMTGDFSQLNEESLFDMQYV